MQDYERNTVNLLPSANSGCCLTECEEETGIQVPGPSGLPGNDGTNGTDGVSAFTLTTASFVMPAHGANVTVNVANSAAAVLGQILFVQNAGEMQVASIPGATSLSLKNLEDTPTAAYTTNAAPGTVIASGSKVGPGGRQGPTGSAAGALLSANNLLDVASPATSRTNLGLGTMATQGAGAVAITGGAITGITDLAVADGGTGASNAANARTNLGLVIGTNVQAWDSDLDAVAGGITAAGLILISDASHADQRGTLDVQTKQGLLGSLIGADFNSTSDQGIAIASHVTKYVIRRVVITNASINLSTAVGGFYAAPAKTTPIVAATQAYTALTTSVKFLDATLTALCGTDVFTQNSLFLSLTTPTGAAATADVFIFGERVQ